ncbi:MAG: hypothetical protein GY906_33985, partial [bacterium]|nr:hypothetical protein [bacterium]
MKQRQVVGALFLASLMFASAGSATSIVPPGNLGELAKMSDAVVLARAVETWNDNTWWLPNTVTRFELLEHVAGDPVEGEFLVSEVGGIKGEKSLQILGAPDYKPGTVYLLSLGHRPDGMWRSRMLSYGLLQQEIVGGDKVLRPVPELNDVALLSETPYEPVQIYAQDKLVQHLRGVVRLGVEWEGESVRSDREGEVIP